MNHVKKNAIIVCFVAWSVFGDGAANLSNECEFCFVVLLNRTECTNYLTFFQVRRGGRQRNSGLRVEQI